MILFVRGGVPVSERQAYGFRNSACAWFWWPWWVFEVVFKLVTVVFIDEVVLFDGGRDFDELPSLTLDSLSREFRS